MKILPYIALLIIIAGLLTNTLFTKRRTQAYENQIEEMKVTITALDDELNNSYLLLKMDSGNVAQQLEVADFIQLKIISVEGR